jgi:hypothetical protein
MKKAAFASDRGQSLGEILAIVIPGLKGVCLNFAMAS